MLNETPQMPLLFVGHGSPMNAIENNAHTQAWAAMAAKMPKPKAILAVSAHWYTKGTRIMDEAHPKIIYDMHGFPDALYQVQYTPKGSPEFAALTRSLIKRQVTVDNAWGLDHGTWSVLCHMFPEQDIPVFQLSVDRDAPAAEHFQIGKELSALREQGILIFASGNVVHNLSRINWQMEGGYPWAEAFDTYIQEKILQKHYPDVIDYQRAGKCAELAFFSPDHFYPLLYILGASKPQDEVTIFNAACTLGALSMTSYLFA